MFLIMLDDGEIVASRTIGDDDLESCHIGVVDIICITDPNKPTQYHDGEWHEIKVIHANQQGK